jgi:two-component system response regulator MtrA
MLTARDNTADVVRGLELGADDFVTTPFDRRELLARVRAALRRQSTGDGTEQVLSFGALAIDVCAARVELAGSEVELSGTELRLLIELARRPGEAISRQTLLQLVWGYDYLGDSRLVDMAVMRLRDKLNDDPTTPRFVGTVRGIGYRFDG